MSGLRLDWAAASDPGRVRGVNQDAAVAEDRVFGVADGMGGHAAGEVASRIAVEALRENAGDGLVDAVRVANRTVWERGTDDASLRGMGTTLAAIALVDDPDGVSRVHVVNVGDSRVYLLRDGELEQITVDHSYVAELEREGRITAEEARVHPQRNIVTRVLGATADVDVDEFPIDPFRGDRFLLCSDGLFNELHDDEIARILRTQKEPQAAVDELVDRANAAGGRDNVTVVVVDVLDDGDRAREASAALAGAASTSDATAVVAPPLDGSGHEGVRKPDPTVTRTGERRRRVTWRSALFTIVLLAIVAAAVGSVWWFARGSFYVGFDGDRVAIFRGRPGGVLWFDPTVEQRTSIHRSDVAPDRLSDLRSGKEEASLSDARAYVRSVTTTTTTATTTTTTTSTVVLPPFAPTTTSTP